MDQIKIGTFISMLRKEKGITQAQLAEYMEVSNRAVSKWERGQSLPDAGRLLQLCEYLGITVNELLLGERFEETEYEDRAEKQLVEYKRSLEHIESLTLGIIFFDLIFNIIFSIIALKITLWNGALPILTLSLLFDLKFIINRIFGRGIDIIIDVVTVSVVLKLVILIVILILTIVLGTSDLLNVIN